MTENDLINYGFTQRITNACCTPQEYNYYYVVNNLIYFQTPLNIDIVNNNWPVLSYSLNYETDVLNDLDDLIVNLEANVLNP